VNVLRSRATIVILILALILAWLILDQTSNPNPVRDAFSRVISPVQFLLQRLASPVGQATAWITHLGSLESDNQKLRSQAVELRNQIILLQEAQIENETLRKQLNFKSAAPNYHLLSAEVIGHDPSNLLQYLIIDRGSKDGIQLGMPVLAAEGLVGRISEVSIDSAKVMLITDPSSSVSALIQRSRATGSVQGYPGDELVMRYIPQGDTVTPGDIVITSGLGGNFPKRLVIGQVVSVTNRDVEMFQEARLVPAVNLRDLETVMVLLSFTPIDLGEEPVAR
jgi:rod shape-determining protein MreC